MPIPLINAISPTLVVISIILPVVTGIIGCRAASSMTLGWFLFVLSFLFQDMFNIAIADYFHGREGVKAVTVDQPGTAGAIVIGWLIPLIGHYLGFGIRRLVKFVRGRNRETSDANEEHPH